MENINYADKKDIRAHKAYIHTEKMNTLYGKEIKESINKTKVYDGTMSKGGFTIIRTTSDGALFSLPEAYVNTKKVLLLNFASYKRPGGGFTTGATAQEESLCHCSNLYNIISQFNDYYKYNNEHLNHGLYLDRALYTPGVIFEDKDGNTRVCDVLTCAAPNRSALTYDENRGHVTEVDNEKALEKRVKFIYDICMKEDIEVAILGAWGCGVFKQDPTTVAKLFDKYFKYSGIYCMYAIPDFETFTTFEDALYGNYDYDL